MSVWEAGLDLGDSVRERDWDGGQEVWFLLDSQRSLSLPCPPGGKRKRPVGRENGPWGLDCAPSRGVHASVFFRTKWKRQTAVEPGAAG